MSLNKLEQLLSLGGCNSAGTEPGAFVRRQHSRSSVNGFAISFNTAHPSVSSSALLPLGCTWVARRAMSLYYYYDYSPMLLPTSLVFPDPLPPYS